MRNKNELGSNYHIHFPGNEILAHQSCILIKNKVNFVAVEETSGVAAEYPVRVGMCGQLDSFVGLQVLMTNINICFIDIQHFPFVCLSKQHPAMQYADSVATRRVILL